MQERLSAMGLLLCSLVLTILVSNAQELKLTSPDDIHKFLASDIRNLVQMENQKFQGVGTVPHPILVSCFEEKTFRYTGGKYQNSEIKYRLHTPKTIRSWRKYPLVVHLHGTGEAGEDNTSSLVHLHSILPVLIGPERQDFFMLVVQCPKDTPGWYFQPSTKDGTLDVLLAAMEHVITENPIDQKQITAFGIYSGGYGVLQLCWQHPHLLAGAVLTNCPPMIMPQSQQQWVQRSGLPKQTQMWSFINKGFGNAEYNQAFQAAIRKRNNSGTSMALTEINGAGASSWRSAMEDYNCFRWMLAQKRGSWFSPLPGVVVHKPHSLLYVLVLFTLPIAIIVFLLWETICEWVSTAYQSVREWVGR